MDHKGILSSHLTCHWVYPRYYFHFIVRIYNARHGYLHRYSHRYYRCISFLIIVRIVNSNFYPLYSDRSVSTIIRSSSHYSDYVPPGALPLTLEVSILIPMLSLYMHKKRFINHFLKRMGSCNKRLYAQGSRSSRCLSARIALIFGILHFYYNQRTIVFQRSLSRQYLLYSIRCCPNALINSVQPDCHPFLQS